MKLSQYNFLKEFSGTKIAFNAMTCALAEVNEDFFEIISDIENGKFDIKKYNKELVSNMKHGGYIIDDDVDEVKRIQFFRNYEKYKTDGLALTIAPTLECNFKCVYCYETPKKGFMSENVQNSLLKMIENKVSEGIKELSITWYGGEPMMAKKIVYSLSERILSICEPKNVLFNAFIITNASLMTEEDIQKLKNYHVTGAQITIDGPPDVHNARRINKSGKSSFDTLINNVNGLLNAGIGVIVRINIDKNNISSTEELLDILQDRISKFQELKIDFGQVAPFTEACKSIEGNCFDNEQYADILLPMYEKVLQRGFTMNKMAVYPKLRLNYCCTDYLTSYVIDFEGNIYKCWNDVGNVKNRCGHVDDEKNEFSNGNIKWVSHNPLYYEKCASCNILPICMGGCPYKVIEKGQEPVCDSIKYNLELVLQYYYQKLHSEVVNEVFN